MHVLMGLKRMIYSRRNNGNCVRTYNSLGCTIINLCVPFLQPYKGTGPI